MTCPRTYAGLLFLTAAVAWGQSTTPLSFEVASVKALGSGRDAAPSGGGGRGAAPKPAPSGGVNYPNVTLKELIRRAYKLTDYQIAAPEWTASERYSVMAKMPDGTNQGDIPAMLQSLLAGRFHLQAHHEQRSVPIYALLALKEAAKLKSDDQGALKAITESNPDWAEKIGSVAPETLLINLQKGHLVAKQVTMAKFADFIKSRMDRPVVDMTEMTGRYSFVLDWLSEGLPGLPTNPTEPDDRIGLPLPSAVQAQLGLKLEKRNSPADVLVVDRVEKIPTEN